MKDFLDLDEPFFSVAIAANLLKIKQHTLKIYEAENLLCPKENPENQRCYSLNDISKGEAIRYLAMNLMLELKAVRLIMAVLENSGTSPKNYLKEIEKISSIKLNAL